MKREGGAPWEGLLCWRVLGAARGLTALHIVCEKGAPLAVINALLGAVHERSNHGLSLSGPVNEKVPLEGLLLLWGGGQSRVPPSEGGADLRPDSACLRLSEKVASGGGQRLFGRRPIPDGKLLRSQSALFDHSLAVSCEPLTFGAYDIWP